MTNEMNVLNKKKVGIYAWHVKNEQKYCIGEWDPARKSYNGLSEYDGAKQRIEQEIKAKNGVLQLSMSDVVIDFAKVLDFYNPDNRTSHFDKIIHSNLTKFFGRDCQVATEIFELPKDWKNPKDIFIDAVKKTASNEWSKFDPSRPQSYSPRKGSQDEAIKAVKAAVKNNCTKFLLGCKCRFGKTFTSYEIAKELGYSNILIMTFRPGDTKEAWKSDLNSHQHFKDYTFYGQDEIEDFSNDDGNKVLFMSFQKAKISSDFEVVKQLHFDMVIIDEDQIGAHCINNRNLIEELNKNFTLVLTGTPELEIMSNEFGDDFYKFDYIDEQMLKENPDTKEFYADMPKLEIYSFDLSNKFVDTIKDLDGFSLAEFFKVENDKFVYAAYVNKFLDYLSMQTDSADELPDCSLGIFANPDFDMSHGLWKLPSIKACNLLKGLLNKHKFFKDYDVEVLPESDKSPKQIEKKCHEGKPTIWLTVMKNTVGVTVKPWTYTISLYGSDNSSLSSYIQFIFRAGSPGKEVFRTFDFCPSRVLDVVDTFAVARCADRTNDDYQAAITKVVNYLPVFAYNNAGGFERLTPNDVFKQIANFTTVRSCRNLLYKEFDLLSDYADNVESIQVQSFNPTITKNEALKKLKKELLKKAENKKKSETEKSENKDFIEKMFQAFIDIYTWVKYDKGVDDIDCFLKNIESYSDDFEGWFEFSDEFMNAFVDVISSSKKNFGIAIERFKMMPFKFAMEDVPETLAEMMLDKFSKKRNLLDAACKGPTLLKMANKRWPDIKLFAYNEDGISKRLMRILEKEVPSVNIIKELKTDMNVIMNPPYTTKVEQGRKRALDLDYPIYKEACKHADEVICLMRRSQKYKKDGQYTGYWETDEDGNDITFDGVGVEVGIFQHKKDLPTIEIKSKYELNGKLDWIKENDLTRKTTTLWHLIDRDQNKFRLGEPVPKGYVAFNEVSTKNFTVFTEGEVPLKKNGDPLRMLVYVRTSNSVDMKKWLLEYVNPLHNDFRRFGDNHIDRGFTRTVEVPKELIPEGFLIDEPMNVIMNPPYNKNLHLKILRKMMQYSDEIVNLSPEEVNIVEQEIKL
jgi:hypothetical protein